MGSGRGPGGAALLTGAGLCRVIGWRGAGAGESDDAQRRRDEGVLIRRTLESAGAGDAEADLDPLVTPSLCIVRLTGAVTSGPRPTREQAPVSPDQYRGTAGSTS